MIRRIQLAVAALLLGTLTVYAFGQKSESATQAEESKIAMEKHENRVIQALGLSAKQKSEYDTLRNYIKAESGKLDGLGAGKVARGKQLNSEHQSGLKRIFSAAQFAKYQKMWQPAPLSVSNPMDKGTPFNGTDEAILRHLGLTNAQWNEYREFQLETEVKLKQYNDLIKQDRNRGAWFGHELNRWTRTEMKRIVGEEKYYEWVRLWDQVMAPFFGNGSKHSGQTRGLGGG